MLMLALQSALAVETNAKSLTSALSTLTARSALFDPAHLIGDFGAAKNTKRQELG